MANKNTIRNKKRKLKLKQKLEKLQLINKNTKKTNQKKSQQYCTSHITNKI
jgi:hypothetical protein